MADPKVDIYFLVFSAIVLFYVFIVSLIVFFIYYRAKQRKNVLEKEELEVKFEHVLLNTKLEMQEQTLKNISQEIHDNIGQVLSLAKLNLATIDTSGLEQVRQKIDDSKNLVAKAIQDLRDLSKSMNTDYVTNMGLARSIEYELEMIKKTGSFDTEFEIEGSVIKLEQKNELILFRIVQEVLNNIIKHARANRISIQLNFQSDYFSLKVLDNGHGFDLNNIMDKQSADRGLGIKNMYNRAKLIGGQFSITSTITEGTIVQIHLPIPNKIT